MEPEDQNSQDQQLIDDRPGRAWNGSTAGGPKPPTHVGASELDDTIANELRLIVAETLGYDVEAIKPETRMMEDLQADWLDLVELECAIEDTMNLTVPEDTDYLTLTTFADWVKLVEGLKPKRRRKQ